MCDKSATIRCHAVREVALKTALDSTAPEVDGEPLSFRRRTVIIDGPDPIDKYVGGQLRLRRAQNGMTQSDFGSKLRPSLQAGQKYATGETPPPPPPPLQLSPRSRGALALFLPPPPQPR